MSYPGNNMSIIKDNLRIYQRLISIYSSETNFTRLDERYEKIKRNILRTRYVNRLAELRKIEEQNYKLYKRLLAIDYRSSRNNKYF